MGAGRAVRRCSALAAAGVLLATTPSVHAQSAPARVFRVGFLHARDAGSSAEDALRAGLRDLGYRVGHNLVFEGRYASGDLGRFPELAADLVRAGVDVIVAPTPQALAAARKATSTIPIVVVVVGDPVRTGAVNSLARPGGTVTGLTAMGSDLGGKRLALLKELLPKLTRVAVFWNPAIPDKVVEWEDMQAPARTLNLQLQSVEIRTRADFPAAFEATKNGGAGAFITLGEPLLFTHRDLLLDFAARHRIPAVYGWKEFVEAGGLMAYGPNIDANYRRAAFYVDRILRGANPADLPIEQPAQLELVVNAKTARTLGLVIPQSLRLRADRIVE